jgi:hypothetical protein
LIERIRTDESLQVLFLIVLPLVLMLLGIAIRLALKPPSTLAIFPTFSVKIELLGRDSFGQKEGFIIFRDETREVAFVAEIPRNGPVYVKTPERLSEGDLLRLVPKVAQGLEKLRYKYVIYRKREPQPINDDEREAAIAELREMGFAIENPLGQGQVQKAVTQGWQRASGKEAMARLSRVQSLMNKARGFRENIEVLARSG